MNCIIYSGKTSSKLLEEFVGKSSSLNLVGTFSDSGSVRNQLLQRQDIELVFLDLEIPETESLDFIRSLDYLPNIIMVSSGDQHARKPFDFNVVDCLLKPFTYSRFCEAVDKSIKYFSPKEVCNSCDNEIFIKKGSSLVKLKLKDIIYIEALENDIILNTKGEKFNIHFTMQAIENQLPSGIFIRVHRSFIVNKSIVQTIKENSLELIIGDERKNIPIDSSFRDQLLKGMNMKAR